MGSDGPTALPGPRIAPDDSAVFAEKGPALSRLLVAFYKDLHGRGPVAARTVLTPELAVTVMYEILTPGEQTLVAGGKSLGVEQMRLRTAELSRSHLIDLAETTLGVKVVASVTGIGVLENYATETFILVPGLTFASG